MEKPQCLDLFCGAGGATKGLQNAGFYVVGIDNRPQPRYCGDEFYQADVMTLPLEFLRSFDFIWASPPCQAHTSLKVMHNAKKHSDLVGPIRERLQESKVSFVIENVVGAPLHVPFMLCGSMFKLGTTVYNGWHQLRRHRLFEASFTVLAPNCEHTGPTIGFYGDHARDRRRRPGVRDKGIDFPDRDKLQLGRDAMGMAWCESWREISQAIPPAYSEFIGRLALQAFDMTPGL